MPDWPATFGCAHASRPTVRTTVACASVSIASCWRATCCVRSATRCSRAASATCGAAAPAATFVPTAAPLPLCHLCCCCSCG
eukprot:364795-Chlamydomonas_euryale.AAC.4